MLINIIFILLGCAVVGFIARLIRRIRHARMQGMTLTLSNIFSNWPPPGIVDYHSMDDRDDISSQAPDAVVQITDDITSSGGLPMTHIQLKADIHETNVAMKIVDRFISDLLFNCIVSERTPRDGRSSPTLENFAMSPILVIKALIEISTHGDDTTRTYIRSILGCSLVNLAPSEAPPQTDLEFAINTNAVSASTYLAAVGRLLNCIDYCTEIKNRTEAQIDFAKAAQRKREQSIWSDFKEEVKFQYEFAKRLISRGRPRGEADERHSADRSFVYNSKDLYSLLFWFNTPPETLARLGVTSNEGQVGGRRAHTTEYVGSRAQDLSEVLYSHQVGSYGPSSPRKVVVQIFGELKEDYSGQGYIYLATDFVCRLGYSWNSLLASSISTGQSDITTPKRLYGQFTRAIGDSIPMEYVTLPHIKGTHLFYTHFPGTHSSASSFSSPRSGYTVAKSIDDERTCLCLEIPFANSHLSQTVGAMTLGVSFSLRIVMQIKTLLFNLDERHVIDLLLHWDSFCSKNKLHPDDGQEGKHSSRTKRRGGKSASSQEKARLVCTLPKIDFATHGQDITSLLQYCGINNNIQNRTARQTTNNLFSQRKVDLTSLLMQSASTTGAAAGAAVKGESSNDKGEGESPPKNLAIEAIGQMARFALDLQSSAHASTEVKPNSVNVEVKSAFYFGVFCHTHLPGNPRKRSSIPIQIGYVVK